jgi:predicted nucleic acid-binding protein
MSVYVDTSVFYAAADGRSVGHDRARASLEQADRLLTSDHVLAESWLLLNGRLSRHAAQAFWAAVRDGAVETVTVGSADLDRAWRIAHDFPDQGFSLVDMTSFSVMERLGLARVATFDHHFAVYRYGPRRDRAFEIAG